MKLFKFAATQISILSVCLAETQAQVKGPPWLTRGAVPTDQILLLSPKGIVNADTKAGKGSVINPDLGEAKERTGVVVAGSLATVGTGPASSALAVIPAAGIAKLDAETEVRLPARADPKLKPLEQAKEEATSPNLELLKGRLFLNIDPEQVKQRGPATFRLRTPSALLAVKGTRFFSETTNQGDLVGVHEGSVVVYHPVTGDSVTLVSGQAVTVSTTEISKPRALNTAEKKLDVNYTETSLRREPLKADWKQPQHPYGKGTKSFHPDNTLGTEYQFALDVATYNQKHDPRVEPEPVPELKIDTRNIKRKAVALEMVVRAWNLRQVGPTISSVPAIFPPLTLFDADARRGDENLPFQGTRNGAPRTKLTSEWVLVVPINSDQADQLPDSLVLQCALFFTQRQFNAEPDNQPVIEITGLTLITEEE